MKGTCKAGDIRGPSSKLCLSVIAYSGKHMQAHLSPDETYPDD